MGLIVTPGRLARLAEWYHQLEQLLSAGIGLIPALKHHRRGVFSEPVRRLLDSLEGGGTFGEALGAASRWFPDFDVALLHAGERSGQLPACFGLLADYYRERAQVLRGAISSLVYPVFLLHFAIFIIPFPALFQTGNLLRYLASTVGLLIPLYSAALLLVYACQGKRGEWWRSLVESCGRCVPVLGAARRHLALSRLATALEALLAAGVSVVQAWPMAAAASGSPALRREVATWRIPLETGTTPAELVHASGLFPEVFADLYSTGELSGKLEQALNRLRHYHREEGERSMRAFAQWLPRFVYGAVILVIAWHVISFWLSYFGQLGEVLQ